MNGERVSLLTADDRLNETRSHLTMQTPLVTLRGVAWGLHGMNPIELDSRENEGNYNERGGTVNYFKEFCSKTEE